MTSRGHRSGTGGRTTLRTQHYSLSNGFTAGTVVYDPNKWIELIVVYVD